MPLLILAVVVYPHEDPAPALVSLLSPTTSSAEPRSPRPFFGFELEVGGPVRVQRSACDRTSEREDRWRIRTIWAEDVDGGEGVRQL